jgi:hypothetical protein
MPSPAQGRLSTAPDSLTSIPLGVFSCQAQPGMTAKMHDSKYQGLPGTQQRNPLSRLQRILNSQSCHSWIQSTALLVAAGWGVYTFIWQDILMPSWAPAHINITVSLSTNASRLQAANSHEEASLTIKAENTSGRKLYLLSNYWQMYGSKHVPSSATAFQGMADRALRSSSLMHAERESTLEFSPLLAMGRVFDDTMLQPGESITRSISVQIPRRYNSFAINIVIPTLTKEPRESLFSGRQLQWGLGKDETPIPLLCSRPNAAQRQSGVDRDLDCKPTPVERVEKDLKGFDRRTQIFSRSEQLMPNHADN